MCNTIEDDFERAMEGVERTITTGHYENGIRFDEFAKILFRVAFGRGRISGKLTEEGKWFLQVSNDTPNEYDFPAYAFRSLLGAIAQYVWSQNSHLPGHKVFNPYGDSREIICEVDGAKEQFHLETGNINGKPLYFVIRKL